MPETSLSVLRLEASPSRVKQHIERIKIDTAIREILNPLKERYTELGAAQSFIDFIEIENGPGITVKLVFAHPICRWLEYGTDPHYIDAVEAEFLIFEFRKTSSWFDSKAGDDRSIFKGESVLHPGFQGYNLLAIMLGTLTQNYTREIVRQVTEYMQRTKMR